MACIEAEELTFAHPKNRYAYASSFGNGTPRQCSPAMGNELGTLPVFLEPVADTRPPIACVFTNSNMVPMKNLHLHRFGSGHGLGRDGARAK